MTWLRLLCFRSALLKMSGCAVLLNLCALLLASMRFLVDYSVFFCALAWVAVGINAFLYGACFGELGYYRRAIVWGRNTPSVWAPRLRYLFMASCLLGMFVWRGGMTSFCCHAYSWP